MAKERNLGLDLCRIISMLGVIVLHIFGEGGVLKNVISGSSSYWIAYSLEALAYSSVSLFALLSGYLNSSREKYSTRRLIELLGCVVFYTIIIEIVVRIVYPPAFGGVVSDFIGILRQFDGAYWYISCYAALFLLFPFINKFLNILTDKQLRILCWLLFFVFSVIPSFASIDFFGMNNGFSCAWLLICYIWGAAYKRGAVKLFEKYEWCVILTDLIIILVLMLCFSLLPLNTKTYMISYVSPFVVLNAMMILQWGIRFQGKPSERISKTVIFCSQMAFDVYILHCHRHIFNEVITNRFIPIASLTPLLIIPVTLLCAIIIYLCGMITGYIRTCLFTTRYVRKFFIRLYSRLDQRLNV